MTLYNAACLFAALGGTSSMNMDGSRILNESAYETLGLKSLLHASWWYDSLLFVCNLYEAYCLAYHQHIAPWLTPIRINFWLTVGSSASVNAERGQGGGGYYPPNNVSNSQIIEDSGRGNIPQLSLFFSVHTQSTNSQCHQANLT